MEAKDFILELDWIDRYCSDNWGLYYDYMYRLIKGLVGGGIFPIINLESPVYYGCDGIARCDGFLIEGDKCKFINRSFNREIVRDLGLLPFRSLRECIDRLLLLEYHF